MLHRPEAEQTYQAPPRQRPSGGRETTIDLPTLHEDQLKAFRLPARFKAVRAGRRWGKTLFGETIAADAAIRQKYIGWFAPEYKFLSEAFTDLADLLGPVIARSSRMDGIIRTTTGGRIDFWSLENERAGRSRRYHGVIIDEAAFTKPNMFDIWRKSIRPTLVDYRGWALVLSNTAGIDPQNFLYMICNEPSHGFVEFHAPTGANPFIPPEELDEIKANTHPLVYEQEYLAEFVDWSGSAFFAQTSLLVDNKPVEYPELCDAVYATIDTAVKDKSEHDGTGVVYWAANRHFAGPKLTILDYDLIHIQGSLLENWLPSVDAHLNELAAKCRARFGAIGIWIEDKNSGTILIQQAQRRGIKAQAIDSKLTALGKDARCISVSGYVHRGDVKISRTAYDERTLSYKGTTRNHLLAQVVGYRVGVDQGEDDLLDAFAYGIAIALGDRGGF